MFQPAQSKAKSKDSCKEISAVTLQKQEELPAGDLAVQSDQEYVIKAQ